jgi:hypothetical protein
MHAGFQEWKKKQQESKTAAKADFGSDSPPFHADFVSPGVSLGVPIATDRVGGGRGCVTTRNLREGELVSVHQALAFALAQPGSTVYTDNFYTRQYQGSESTQLLSAVVALLCRRPTIGRRVYSLTSGPDFSAANEQRSMAQQATASEEQEDDDDRLVDVPRLDAILKVNSFGFEETAEMQTLGESGRCGLWVEPAYFNHSCVANCVWATVGDVLFVRTVRPVGAGEELCIPYLDTSMPWTQRADVFARWIRPGVGFECVCAPCAARRGSFRLQRACKLVSQAVASSSPLPLAKCRRLLADLSQLPLQVQHDTGRVLNTWEACHLARQGDTRAALKAMERAAEISYCMHGLRVRKPHNEPHWCVARKRNASASAVTVLLARPCMCVCESAHARC